MSQTSVVYCEYVVGGTKLIKRRLTEIWYAQRKQRIKWETRFEF